MCYVTNYTLFELVHWPANSECALTSKFQYTYTFKNCGELELLYHKIIQYNLAFVSKLGTEFEKF